MSEHTPTPWNIEGTTRTRGGAGFIVSHGVNGYGDGPAGYVCDFIGAKSDVDFMLRAVNSHEALVGALRNFLDNPLFQIAVGGNPNAVDRMIVDAKAVLKLASTP